MLYKKFTLLTFPKNVHTLNTRIYFCDSMTLVRSGLLSEADSCPNRYYRVSDKRPLQKRVRFTTSSPNWSIWSLKDMAGDKLTMETDCSCTQRYKVLRYVHIFKSQQLEKIFCKLFCYLHCMKLVTLAL